MKTNYENIIIKSPLFAEIKKKDLPDMLKCMGAKTRKYRKGEIVLLMNDEVRYIDVVLQGRIHMVKENSLGDLTLLSIIGLGEVFGESFACGDDLLAYTTFVAVEDTVVLEIPFHKVMHACTLQCVFHHRLIENMVTMMANKNVRLMEKIDVSSQKSLREKILRFLEIQAQRQNSNCVEIDMNRTVLADYLGVNRSALARELTQLKEEGILDFDKNYFTLLKKN